MRILLLSAYDAASHRRWRRGLVAALPEHEWQLLTLPARYFSWRIRGNSLSWAFGQRAVLEQHYDLIIATSMVDLSALKGMVPSLAAIPTIVYFHENQFAYPGNDRQHSSVEPQMVNLYTALCAQRLVFNSDFNRQSFIDGVESLLGKLPDQVPPNLVQRLDKSSEVLAVPLESECFRQPLARPGEPLHIVWNHRWEYDKGPDRLLALVRQLLQRGIAFSLSVLGEGFRQVPIEFDQLQALFASSNSGSLRHWGFVESVDDYREILAGADVALSTAVHDFQGLAVMEAVAMACVPLVPDRLCYPEWFADEFRYASCVDDIDTEANGLADKVEALANSKLAANMPQPPSLQAFGWEALQPNYQSLISKVVAQAGSLYDRRP